MEQIKQNQIASNDLQNKKN